MDALGIATLLTQGIAPPQGSADIGFHTGVIVSWDESSGTNVVTVQGVNMSNLNALQGGIGVLYQPGDVVGLIRFQTTYFVLGKVAAPGAGAANQIRSNEIDVTVNQPLQGYGDLTGSVGPTLNNVYIGSSRRCLVMVGCQMEVNDSWGKMGFQVSGASTLAPVDIHAAMMGTFAGLQDSLGSVMTHVLLTSADGLNQGFHTFQAKYAIVNGGGSPAGTGAVFRSRILTVIPF